MNVEKYQACYYEMSGKASEIARTLSLAGLGVIWIFKLDQPDGTLLAKDLVSASIWIVAALAFDLAQYLYLAGVWLVISYVYEKRYGHAATGLSHNLWWPRVGEFIFVAKIICLAVGYWHIAEFLLQRVRVA